MTGTSQDGADDADDGLVLVHQHAIVESSEIGPRSRIGAFAHVRPGARIGSAVDISDGVFIENDVIVGDRVTVKSGVQLWDGLRIEDDVFVGSNATFANDRFPRSQPGRFLPIILREGCSVGAGAVVLPGVTIGEGAMVGAGAVVTCDVPPRVVVAGNPAQIIGYADVTRESDGSSGTALAASSGEQQEPPVFTTLLRVPDLRGELIAGEVENGLPFAPQRIFMVHSVPSRRVRGEHAHRQCRQFLIAVAGSVRVVMETADSRREVLLDSPHRGLLIEPMVWGVQYNYSADAVLLVLASHPYDEGDYIRSYDTWRLEVNKR
ncbi:WxcM-like domain-containing protein [Nocardioides sp. P5_E3]